MAIASVAARPPVRAALDVQRRYGEDGGSYLAVAISYYAFLSLFPLTLVALSVVGFVIGDDPRTRAEWASRMASTVPGLGDLVDDALGGVVRSRAGTGIVGLAGLFWSGTAVARAAGHALERVFRRPRARGFVRTNLWAVGSTVALGALALSGVVLSGAAGAASLLALPLALVVHVLLFLAAYRILTPGSGPSWTALAPGAVFAGTGWTLLQVAGSWYAARTVRSNQVVYGTLATVVATLVLLYLAARLFVYGAEVAAVIGPRDGDMKNQMRVADPSAQSTPELVSSIATDLGTLVRKEMELARMEMVEAVVARLQAAAAAAAGGVIALLALGFAALAAAHALDAVLATWASRLVVAGVLAVFAVLAGTFAVIRRRRPSIVPDDTVRTVKEDIGWARARLRR